MKATFFQWVRTTNDTRATASDVAASDIRNGIPAQQAIGHAARAYGLPCEQIASELGKAAARLAALKEADARVQRRLFGEAWYAQGGMA